MDEFLKNTITGGQGLLAYATVFGILVACGLGVPLPEDISLILGGFLAHRGSVDLYTMMAVGFVGILAGDSLIYLAGRKLGSKAGSTGGLLARVVTPAKRAKVESLFAVHGQKIVMIARFLPGVRAVTYFTAGSAGMSYARFIFWDGLAALASAPLFVYLGYHFGGELEQVFHKLKQGQVAILVAMVLAALAYGLYRRSRNAAMRRELLAASSRPAQSDAPV